MFEVKDQLLLLYSAVLHHQLSARVQVYQREGRTAEKRSMLLWLTQGLSSIPSQALTNELYILQADIHREREGNFPGIGVIFETNHDRIGSCAVAAQVVPEECCRTNCYAAPRNRIRMTPGIFSCFMLDDLFLFSLTETYQLHACIVREAFHFLENKNHQLCLSLAIIAKNVFYSKEIAAAC